MLGQGFWALPADIRIRSLPIGSLTSPARDFKKKQVFPEKHPGEWLRYSGRVLGPGAGAPIAVPAKLADRNIGGRHAVQRRRLANA